MEENEVATNTAKCDSCTQYKQCTSELKEAGICDKYETKITAELDKEKKRVRFHCSVNDRKSAWYKPWQCNDPPSNLEKIASKLNVRSKDVYLEYMNKVEAFAAEAKPNIHKRQQDRARQKKEKLARIQRKREELVNIPHELHPAGGLHENFVYEPISSTEYVYKMKDGTRGLAKVQVEYEDEENEKKPHWFIEIDGEQHYFSKKIPKTWLFYFPPHEIVDQWINGEKKSKTTEEFWRFNSMCLRVFLDFPHPFEFSAVLIFIVQCWLSDILNAVFYLGPKGEFGGGKTVAGETIVSLCRHGFLTGNLSAPFIARAIESQKVVLMVDELDSVAGTKDSNLLSIFRQGYRRGLRYSRVNPDTLEPESFDIFGPKLFTVYASIEEALQSRTLPIHVRETSDPQFPVVNIDKRSFLQRAYTENFLWYMDNVLTFRDNDMHAFNITNGVELVEQVDLKSQGPDIDEHASKIRSILFTDKISLLSEGQLGQLHQLVGRNVELLYCCFVLSNMIGIKSDEDFMATFRQKIVEDRERTEIGYLGILKDVLTEAWQDHKDDSKYLTKSGFVKVSNKEIYGIFIKKMKDETGRGVSPATFKKYLLAFGFSDSLNRTDLKVPLPDKPEPSSRLCNIYTVRVLRKLGLEETVDNTAFASLKSWCLNHKDDENYIDLMELSAYVTHELNGSPTVLIDEAYKHGFLRKTPTPGRAYVQTSLQNKLTLVVSVIVELQHETGLCEKTVVLNELETKHKIPKEEGKQLLSQLLREAIIFEPRPGYIKKT